MFSSLSPIHRLALTGFFSTSLALFVSASASAAPLSEWGTEVTVSTANCPSFCTDFIFGPASGGQNQATASSTQDDSRGRAKGFVTMDPSSGLEMPVLKAEAYSLQSSQGSAFSTVFATEGYTYTGTGSKEFNLDIMLTASVSDPTPNDLDTFVEAKIYVFYAEDFAFTSDLASLIFEYGAEVVDSVEYSIRPDDPDAADAMREDTFTFTLDSGDIVYLLVLMDAEAERELSFADAFSTLETTFQDPDGLVAASSIPEPGTASLLALGLASLSAVRRRRRRFESRYSA